MGVRISRSLPPELTQRNCTWLSRPENSGFGISQWYSVFDLDHIKDFGG